LDYPTSDGTEVRDFIHIMDLAEGDVVSLSLLELNSSQVMNLGTEVGYSVIDVATAFEKACNKKFHTNLLP
jgi:UDP-glucose 4-epimerase